MPHLKEAKTKDPLWKKNDYLAQKKGFRNTVYSVNGDEYTGEWLDNLKHGRLTIHVKSYHLGRTLYCQIMCLIMYFVTIWKCFRYSSYYYMDIL